MNIWQLFMLLRWSLWLHFTPRPHQSYLLCDKQGFLITNPFRKVRADIKDWLHGTLLLLCSNIGVELSLISAPPTWSNCLRHMEGGRGSPQWPEVSLWHRCIYLGIGVWISGGGLSREPWPRPLLRPPRCCHTLCTGVAVEVQRS